MPADASFHPRARRSRPARRPCPLHPPPPLGPFPLRLVPLRLRPPPPVPSPLPLSPSRLRPARLAASLPLRRLPASPRLRRVPVSPPLRRLVASPPPPQIRSKSRYNRTRSTESCPRRRAMHDHGARTIVTDITRRGALRLTAALLATLTGPAYAAQKAKEKAKEKAKGGGRASFAQWVDSFKPRALARGVSEATYTRVMRDIKPDTSVYALDRSQPEFTEKLWQYINRRVSDWRITEGRAKAKGYAALLDRIEQDFGVSRAIMLGLWGVESAYGDPDVQKTHMRP